MCCLVLSNDILIKMRLKNENIENETHRLRPSPVARKEVLKSALAIWLKFAIGCVIKFSIKIWVPHEFANNCEGIPEPDVVFCIHPRRNIVVWFFTLVLRSKALPPNVCEWRYIHRIIEILVISKWWVVAVFEYLCRPDVQ